MDDSAPSESAAEYATRIGKSEQTVHRRLKAGKLKGFKRPLAGEQFQWRVYLDQSIGDDDSPDNAAGEGRTNAGEGVNATADTPSTSDDTRLAVVLPLLETMERERADERAQWLDALARARQEVGFYQGLLLAQAGREEEPIEDTSGTVGGDAPPEGIRARLRAWWKDGRDA